MIKQMNSKEIKEINELSEWKRTGREQGECFISGAFVAGVIGLVMLIVWVVLVNKGG